MIPSPTQRQDAWLWRLIATALAFGLFGLGGLFLRGIVFPLQSMLPGSQRTRQRRARGVICLTFHYFVRFLQATRVLTLTVNHSERLGSPGQLIIANHPSLLDVVLLIGLIKDANCVVKHGLSHNPYTRGPVRAAGYITNDARAEMLDDCARILREGETLIIFPEGTRTPPGTMPVFHRGACAIALRGARLVTPVVISMESPSLSKGQPWYHIPNRRIHYQIDVGQPMDLVQWKGDLPRPVASRRMNQTLQDYFQQALAHL